MACSHGRRHLFPESAGYLLPEKAQHCSLPFPFLVVVQAATRPSSTSSSFSSLSYCDVHRTQPAAARAQHSSSGGQPFQAHAAHRGQGWQPGSTPAPCSGPKAIGEPRLCPPPWSLPRGSLGSRGAENWGCEDVVLSLCIGGCQRKGKPTPALGPCPQGAAQHLGPLPAPDARGHFKSHR